MVNIAPVYHDAGIKRFPFFKIVHSTETNNRLQYETKPLSTASVLVQIPDCNMRLSHF